jgi:hypothetical protein
MRAYWLVLVAVLSVWLTPAPANAIMLDPAFSQSNFVVSQELGSATGRIDAATPRKPERSLPSAIFVFLVAAASLARRRRPGVDEPIQMRRVSASFSHTSAPQFEEGTR